VGFLDIGIDNNKYKSFKNAIYLSKPPATAQSTPLRNYHGIIWILACREFIRNVEKQLNGGK